MRTYEKQLSTDTFLCGGLIAVAMAWLAFSAVQVAPGGGHREALSGMATVVPAQSGSAGAPDIAVLPAAASNATSGNAGRAG